MFTETQITRIKADGYQFALVKSNPWPVGGVANEAWAIGAQMRWDEKAEAAPITDVNDVRHPIHY